MHQNQAADEQRIDAMLGKLEKQGPTGVDDQAESGS